MTTKMKNAQAIAYKAKGYSFLNVRLRTQDVEWLKEQARCQDVPITYVVRTAIRALQAETERAA